MRSVIAGLVDHTVTLGQSGYGNALTITASGIVAPANLGSNGIYVPSGLADASVLNQGAIYGAQGPRKITEPAASASTPRPPRAS